jgi:chromosome segregation ATPase
MTPQNFDSLNGILLFAVGNTVLLIFGALGLVMYTRRLTVKNNAQQRSVEIGALEDDTKSSGILRDFALKWDGRIEELTKDLKDKEKTINQQEKQLAVQEKAISTLEEWKREAEQRRLKDEGRIDEQKTLIDAQKGQIDQLIKQNEEQQRANEEIRQYWQDALATVDEVKRVSKQFENELIQVRESEMQARQGLNEALDALSKERKENRQLRTDNLKLTEENESYVEQIKVLRFELPALPAADDGDTAKLSPADRGADKRRDAGSDSSTDNAA